MFICQIEEKKSIKLGIVDVFVIVLKRVISFIKGTT